MKTFFVSDTHFRHKNILKYEPCRLLELAKWYSKKIGQHYELVLASFQQMMLEEKETELVDLMNEMLIEYWNETVGKNDFVWFLGDFVYGNKEIARDICSKLHGRKRLVRGNHDNWPDNFYREIGFEYVSKYPVLLKNRFILSHAPLEKVSEPFINIYGHIHWENCKHIPTKTETSQCVCVERQDFRPIRIKEFDKEN